MFKYYNGDKFTNLTRDDILIVQSMYGVPIQTVPKTTTTERMRSEKYNYY